LILKKLVPHCPNCRSFIPPGRSRDAESFRCKKCGAELYEQYSRYLTASVGLGIGVIVVPTMLMFILDIIYSIGFIVGIMLYFKITKYELYTDEKSEPNNS